YDLAYAGQRYDDWRRIGRTIQIVGPLDVAGLSIECGQRTFILTSDMRDQNTVIDDWRHGCAEPGRGGRVILRKVASPFHLPGDGVVTGKHAADTERVNLAFIDYGRRFRPFAV